MLNTFIWTALHAGRHFRWRKWLSDFPVSPKDNFRKTNIKFASPLADRRPYVRKVVFARDRNYTNRRTHERVQYSIRIFINSSSVSKFITLKYNPWCENSVFQCMGLIQIEAVWGECAEHNILFTVNSTGTAAAHCKRPEVGGGRHKLRIRWQNILSRSRVGLYGYEKKQLLYVQSIFQHATSYHNGHTLIHGLFHASFTYCYQKPSVILVCVTAAM